MFSVPEIRCFIVVSSRDVSGGIGEKKTRGVNGGLRRTAFTWMEPSNSLILCFIKRYELCKGRQILILIRLIYCTLSTKDCFCHKKISCHNTMTSAFLLRPSAGIIFLIMLLTVNDVMRSADGINIQWHHEQLITHAKWRHSHLKV